MRVTRRWTAYLFPTIKIKTMKLHLPKALLLSVVAVVATGAVQAASTTVIPQIIVDSDEALKAALTTETPVTGAYTKPVVWESTKKTTISGFDANITAPLYVREGDLTIENSELKSVIAPGISQSQIVVSGKNSSLTFSGTNFKDSSARAFIQVGGPDGNGTLNISDKSNVQITYSLCAGFHKDANWSDKFYIINSTTETAQGGNRYDAGMDSYIKDTNPNGTVRYRGKGTINVNSGSTLAVGNALFLAEADLNIDNATVNSGKNGSREFENTDWWNRLGRQTGSETNVNITNGGAWNTNGGSIVTGVQDLNGTEVNIKVSGTKDGKASTLNVRGAEHGTIALGIGTQSDSAANNKNVTTLTIADGGKVLAKDIMLGVQEAKGYYGNDSVTVKVGEASSMESDLITIAKGATVTNYGTIVGDITLQDNGSLISCGGVISGLEATGGTFAVYGGMGTKGDITLTGASFIFTDGAVIDLKGNDFTYGEGNSITIIMSNIMLADADGEYVLQGLTFENAGTVTGLSEDVEVTLVSGADDTEGTKVTLKASDIKVNAVPEPTTATLSLLALAALAGRRRRK